MSERRSSYYYVTTTHFVRPVMGDHENEKLRERLWRRLMQARRAGAHYAIVDLKLLTVTIGYKPEALTDRLMSEDVDKPVE